MLIIQQIQLNSIFPSITASPDRRGDERRHRLPRCTRSLHVCLGSQVVHTGPIDEFFNLTLGPLPYRSLRWDMIVHEKEYAQKWYKINYPLMTEPQTRDIEIKRLTGQKIPRTGTRVVVGCGSGGLCGGGGGYWGPLHAGLPPSPSPDFA